MLLYKAEHLLHPLGGDLFLLRDLGLPADALGAQQPQRRREIIPHPVLVIKGLHGNRLPGFPQAGQHLRLPGHSPIQQKKRRGIRLEHGSDELLPEDGVHSTHQPGMEHTRVKQGLPFFRMLHRVEDAGVQEHALIRLQGHPGLVHVHRQGAFHGQYVLKLLVPVPGHRIAFQVLRVAGNGKQGAAMLDHFPPLGIGHNILLEGQPGNDIGSRDTACLKRHIEQFLSAIL